MTCAVARYSEPTPIEGAFLLLGTCCRIVLDGAALCLTSIVAVATTFAVVTLAAVWLITTLSSASANLDTRGPLGLQAVALNAPSQQTMAWAKHGGAPLIIPLPGESREASAKRDQSRIIPLSANAREDHAKPYPVETFTPTPVLASVGSFVPMSVLESELSVAEPAATPVPLARPKLPKISSPVAVASAAPAPIASKAPAKADAPIVTASLPPKVEVPKKQLGGSPLLQAVDNRTAVYDIGAGMVYMPDGSRLEAHSGLGKFRDDANHADKKNRGPTPPNVYNLKLREALFHGVRAVRLNPTPGSTMHGRDGILAHTYMLGPTGQSFGCVSFKNYNTFLQAFLRGEVTKMVVVPRLGISVAQLVAVQRSATN